MTIIDEVLSAPMSGQLHAVSTAASRWASLLSAPNYNRAVLVGPPERAATMADLDDLLAEAEQVPGDMHATAGELGTAELADTREGLTALQREVLDRLPD